MTRAFQYTITMFLIDVSPSMGDLRTVELPPGPEGEPRSAEMTNLEWALKYVKLKVQQMASSLHSIRVMPKLNAATDICGKKDRQVWCSLVWDSRCGSGSLDGWSANLLHRNRQSSQVRPLGAQRYF
jgi:hypothetical protein